MGEADRGLVSQKTIEDRAVQSEHNLTGDALGCLRKDIMALIRKHGFYAGVLMRTNKKADYTIDYAAVSITHGKMNLYINPINYPKLSASDRLGVVIHETLHLILGHVTRRKQRDLQLWNEAADLAINQLIPTNISYISLPEHHEIRVDNLREGIVFPSKLSAEAYYKLLIEHDKEKKKEEAGAPTPSMGTGGESSDDAEKPQDWHHKWEESEGSDVMNDQAVKQIIHEELRKNPGNVSADLHRQLNEFINSKIPWERKLKAYTGRYVKAFSQPTYKRENRRLGALAKGQRKATRLSIAVVHDTSASIRKDDLKKMAGELVRIQKSGAQVTVIECDTEVKNTYPFTGNIERITNKGGGGTSLKAPFDYLRKHRKKIDLLIYMTDGYGETYDKMPYPTIWVLTKDGVPPSSKSHKKINWGKFVKID